MSHFVINLWIELLLRRVSESGGEVLLDDLVVGADGDGGEVDVPDGVVGRGDRGERRLRPPLVVDRRDQHAAQHAAAHEQHQPQVSEGTLLCQLHALRIDYIGLDMT